MYRTLIKQQVALFPKSINFDYMKIFGDENDSTFMYMNDELMGFVENQTGEGVTSRKVSELYAYSRKMKCMILCSLLVKFNIMMDPSATFVQTLIGLACYAQWLRDKGMKPLNTSGVTASVFYIRQHSSWWAKIRKAINGMSPKEGNLWQLRFLKKDVPFTYFTS